MIKGDPGTGESLLNRGRNARGVSVGGDRDGAAVIELREGGAYVLGNRVRITPLRDLTVLDIPPHRRLRHHVLRLSRAAVHCQPDPAANRTTEQEGVGTEDKEQATTTCGARTGMGDYRVDWLYRGEWIGRGVWCRRRR